MDEDFANEWLGYPKPVDTALIELAREYYRRAEEYDRTVCTGPVTRDGVMPTNPKEFALVNRNARDVYAEVLRRVKVMGFEESEFRKAMQIACEEE